MSFFTKSGELFSITIDTITLMLTFGWFIFSFVAIGIIKLISMKKNKFIYESKKFIIYFTFLFHNFAGLSVLLFHNYIKNELINCLLIFIYYILFIFILYYFWKYRLEIVIGMLLTNLFVYKINFWFSTYLIHTNKPDLLSKFMQQYLGLAHVTNPMKGVVLLLFLVIFLTITIFLRKKGVYDYRSSQEQRQEEMQEGYYARYR
jgi:hypothetical protein